MKRINYLFLLFIATILFISSSCSSEQSKKELNGYVLVDGSSTVFPIAEAVAEEFNKLYPKIKITVGESGTGGGFKKFSRNEIDIINASRTIKQEEKDLCKEKNINYLELLIAYDGLAVVVHSQNTWVQTITVAELKKIWEPEAQGKILKWNQIRPEWPNKEIHLFGPGTASGTFDFFTETIVGKAKSCRGDFTASEDDNVLVKGISSDPLALGYFGMAYFEHNIDKLKSVAIDAGDGPVLPSFETVKNKTYKPLSRPLYIYINSERAKREEVKIFISFFLDKANDLIKEVGYVPLSDEEFATTRKIWNDFLDSLN